MRMSTQSPFEWQELNQSLKEVLSTEANVFVYRGLHQALFETCFGLHLRFSNKKRVIAETGFGDHLKKLEVELSKRGVRVKSEFSADMSSEEKETLVYLHDLDDAITAEVYDHIQTLKQLTETKIYRIHVAHHLFHIKKSFIQKLSEFDIMVCALSPEYALVFTGEKVVLPQLTVAQLAWNKKVDGDNIKDLIVSNHSLYPKEVQAFESSLPEGVEPWFDQNASRIFDRAAVVCKNHDASAIRELLLEEMQIENNYPGQHGPIETASYCRWQNEVWFEQAESKQRSKNDMRGLLLIDGAIINDEFTQKFLACYQKIGELSSL